MDILAGVDVRLRTENILHGAPGVKGQLAARLPHRHGGLIVVVAQIGHDAGSGIQAVAVITVEIGRLSHKETEKLPANKFRRLSGGVNQPEPPKPPEYIPAAASLVTMVGGTENQA